jgi:hypothetical protein
MTKKKHLRFLFTFLYCFFWGAFYAQDSKTEVKKPDRAVLITPSISTQFAGGDFSDRFGTSFTAGLGAGIKTSQNWIFSIDAQFMFGSDVKNVDQMLASIYTENENILNQTGNSAQLSVFQRGFYGIGEISKVFHQIGVNPNSGPSISVGAGFINHWIQFNNAGNDSPQIIEEYEKGYDRYSGGFLLKQSIGYIYLSPNRRVNLKISFELLQAFTTNYRAFNYDTGMEDTNQHLDLLYGIRVNWYLPIYEKQIDQFYYD